jgi:hypothetical protein
MARYPEIIAHGKTRATEGGMGDAVLGLPPT